jgi:hypothetical protein
MSRQAWVLAISLALTPALASAGGRAVIQSGDNGESVRSQIEFDGDQLRVQALGEEGKQGYMIVRDGRAYTVVDQGGGSPMVIDTAAMMKTVGGLISGQDMRQPSLGAEGMARFVSLSDAGRSETVAGIPGRVHTLTYVDSDGATRTETLVLSKDGRVRELTDAMLVMGKTITAIAGVPANAASDQFAAQLKGQGLLRHGNTFTLVSLSADRPAAARFVLPAEPTQLPDLGAMTGGQTGGGQGGGLGAIFGNKAERQQQRVESRADSEVDEATDSVVDKGLEKVFGKLFGE